MVEKMAAKMDNAMDDQQVVESADYLVGWQEFVLAEQTDIFWDAMKAVRSVRPMVEQMVARRVDGMVALLVA